MRVLFGKLHGRQVELLGGRSGCHCSIVVGAARCVSEGSVMARRESQGGGLQAYVGRRRFAAGRERRDVLVKR
ncbi:hypothetical protein E2C01_032244 [Portunus trituberculatus]|uniref:Uncharacterized protein n=1 Tax=Portunus trituberculatus TaxID=210409 RepID=A0A5B7EVI9_PORTR|nr:hypothetical protein [Portunus trituberculatus]